MSAPGTINMAMTIAGTAVGDYVLYAEGRELVIENVLTSQVDTMTCQLDTPPVTPQEWQEVVISNGASKLFAGYLQTVASQQFGSTGSKILYTVSATDYSILLAKTFVKAEYKDKTDAYIINDLFTANLPEIETSTYVEILKTYEQIRFNRISLEQILIKICEMSGADYYVDYDKKLHFFSTSTNDAPFSISSSPDFSASFPHRGMTKEVDGTQVVNIVEVVGGTYVPTTDETFYLKGTGQDSRVQIPFRIRAPEGETSIQVYRNDGTAGWTQLTVLVGYINTLTSTDQVLFYYQESVLEQQNNWPLLENAVKVICRRETPLRTRVRNNASYVHYGRWLQDVIKDATIATKNEAIAIGRNRLVENSIAQPAIRCTIFEPGIRSGMMLPVVDSRLSINATYLVQRATMRITHNKNLFSDLELGAYDRDLIDIIRSITRKFSDSDTWRDDEVLDEILDAYSELFVSDYLRDIINTAGPYTWDNFDWNFGVWS